MIRTAKQTDSQITRKQRAINGNKPGMIYYAAKRTIDIVVSLTLLVLVSPVLVLCIVQIKFVDAGPAFYSQWRVGRDGWLFKIYKLRTMYQDAEKKKGAQFASKGDPRILPGCRWVRRSHVDELPQLINILIGNMSLVGPRPERPEILQWLSRDIPGIEKRLNTPPGLTGLAQVKNGYTNDVTGARKKQAYDLRYLRRRSILNDLKLIFATFPKVWDKAAY